MIRQEIEDHEVRDKGQQIVDILKLVSKEMNVPAKFIASKSQARPHVAARRVAIKAIRQLSRD